MKKVLILILILTIALSMAACDMLAGLNGGKDGTDDSATDAGTQDRPADAGYYTVDEDRYGSPLLPRGSEQSLLYAAIHERISAVTCGEATSTSFTIKKFKMESTTSTFSQNLKRVLGLLWLSLPYELYWYEEESGYDVQGSPDGDTITFTVKLPVAQDFRGSNRYEVDPTSKTLAAEAAKYADTIAAQATGTDAEKLLFFRNQICELSEYDIVSDNAQLAGQTKCGNKPWQMISVFDQNHDTKVVCAGYAKAFKYLCDKVGIDCKVVNGDMFVQDGEPIAHFWNVVTLNGQNYIADLTNCDEGELGYPDLLLLAGGIGSLDEGYTTDVGITYRYYTYGGRGKTDMRTVFGENEIAIAASGNNQ